MQTKQHFVLQMILISGIMGAEWLHLNQILYDS